jgi:Flp pilus assembly protein TadG
MKLHGRHFYLRKKKNNLSHTQGSASIEFALISPAFLLLLIGIFEMGTFFYLQATLDLALLNASRFGRTGQAVTGQTPQQTVAGLVSLYTFNLVDPTKLTLTATPYPNFASVPTNSQVISQKLNNGTQNFGTANQVVLYTLTYQWTFYTHLIGDLIAPNTQGKVTIITSTIVQNEPF